MSASTLVNAQVITTSGNSGDGCVGPTGTIVFFVNVTAVSGTLPTMDLAIELSPDGVTWYPGQPAITFTQITTTVKAAKTVVSACPHFRVVWTVGGTTPSFTVTIGTSTYPLNRVASV